MFYICLIFQQLELLNTLTWRKIAGSYFQNKEFTMIFPSALNPEGSLESPKPHQPQPNTISICLNFHVVSETRLQHTITLKTQVVMVNSDTVNSVAKLACLSYYCLLFGQIMYEPFSVNECYFHYCRFGGLPKEIQVNFLMNILLPLQRPDSYPLGLNTVMNLLFFQANKIKF